jgi:hypothetical protein
VIKAIETEYRGYRFRSRLEWRWALFFDSVGLRWEYEPEGFEFDGTRYLPDFWLPDFENGCYVEVKPTNGDFAKAIGLIDAMGPAPSARILLLEGPPDTRGYVLCGWCAEEGDEPYLARWQVSFDVRCLPARAMYWPSSTDILGFAPMRAIHAARAARAEHGEKPRAAMVR